MGNVDLFHVDAISSIGISYREPNSAATGSPALIEVTAELAQAAGGLAHDHGLRGYDAVHLAAAQAVSDDELVLVSGDVGLAAVARSLGITVTVVTAT